MLDDGISRLAKQALPRKTSVETRLPFLRALILNLHCVGGLPQSGAGRIVLTEHIVEFLPCQFPLRSTTARLPPPMTIRGASSLRLRSSLIEGLRLLGARSILEVGAGTGNYTGALTASGFSVTALDRSPAMVEIGAHKTSARWILSDASALPLRTRSVDAIAGSECAAPSSRVPGSPCRIQACRARGRRDAGGSPRESRDAVVSPLFSRDRRGAAAASSDAWKFDHGDVSRRLFARRGGEDLLLGTRRSYFRSGTHAASSLVRFEFPRIDLGISAA